MVVALEWAIHLMAERFTRPVGLLKAIAFCAVVTLVAGFAPRNAMADDALRSVMGWDQMSVALHLGTLSFFPHETEHTADLTAAAPQLEWLGTTPHISFVARDWGVSQVLWGHLTVADQLRLSRSSRMVVGRLRFAGGRLAPFAQIGVGQWRVDTSVVATLPTDVELAGQLGGGFELEIAPSAALILQGDCTFIFPEGREPQMLSSGHVWGTLLAARARF
jgi:hypothetical protein